MSDKLLYNGQLTDVCDVVDNYNALRSRNFAYQDILTVAHKAQNIALHYHFIAQGLAHAPKFSAEDLQKGIQSLLKANRYPSGWILVRLYATSDQWVVAPLKQLLYNYPTLWHARPRAITIRYGQSFAYHCASTLTAADGAQEMAQLSGTDVAIREDDNGVLCGIGDMPLFCVKDGVCYTTPIYSGAMDSVLRRWAIALIEKAGVELIESNCMADDMDICEMFVTTPQGITSLFSINARQLYSSVATRLSTALPSLLSR